MKHLVLAAGAATLAHAACTPSAPQAEGVIVLESEYSVRETLVRIEAEAESRGARIFARVDHAAGAETAGVEMEPTGLIIFGNPALGTPLIAERRTAGLDLPVRMLVWEDDGEVWLAYTDPDAIAARHGLSRGDALDQFTEALNGFAREVTGEE
ncbi:DUF302 domain-containing protein [Hyphobacterium sp. SN044]|uniref:DUF302 domain-containing protein n=1 Tax=Hyphobacterium sp. SN044 TaxID=2912575 RepID=UPI001F1DA6E6|nr:DUF302 domain-containing protein [Hyphobacterium sp. SN044]MCF8879497.1 DUF302 domain-containing protein [Hyphobacterium sp. SN044]